MLMYSLLWLLQTLLIVLYVQPIEIKTYRSATGGNNYEELPIKMKRIPLREFMSGPYKKYFMTEIAKCSDYPQAIGSADPWFEKKVYTFNKCINFAMDKMPSYLLPGYYKMVLITTGTAANILAIVCPSSEIYSSNRLSQSSRTHSFVKSEPLRNKTVALCDVFICDLSNRTGLILFNNTVKYTEPEAYLPKLPMNIFKKPILTQAKPVREIGDFLCLDNNGQALQKSYCNNVANYPTHSMLESMVKRQFTNFEKLLTQDLVLPVEIGQRANHEPDKVGEQLLCDTVQRTIFPKSGKTNKNKWMLIVNDEENYKQGVRAEECINTGKPCKFVDKPSDYSVTCKQNYRLHRLWAIKDNITIAQEQFEIPCCCQCVWKSTINFLSITATEG